jgi:hypothetical protein
MPRNLTSPTGNDAETEFHRGQARRTGRELPLRSSSRVKVQRATTGTFLRMAKQPVKNKTCWHFESKIEADNTKNYPAQSVIHIQPTDALVTTGIRDAANPSGPLVKSCAGYWVSTQAVAAKKTVGGNDVWNLPQYPYPNAANMDDPANFWIYLGEMDCGA